MPVKAPHLLPWVWWRVRVALFTNSTKQAKRPFKNLDPVIILNVNTLAAGATLGNSSMNNSSFMWPLCRREVVGNGSVVFVLS